MNFEKPFTKTSGLIETMRWFGPTDPVSLQDIAQAGCTGVVTALHHIPNGEVWPIAEIEKRKHQIESAGLSWDVVESVPVSESIKKRSGPYEQHIANYCQTLQNLSQCGIRIVTYNFMPVLDWTRTSLDFTLAHGGKALFFKKAAIVAFDVFILERPGAREEYAAEDMARASAYWQHMNAAEKQQLERNIIAGLPGSEEKFGLAEFREALAGYAGIDAAGLALHLQQFLEAVIPTAESAGVQLVIHPDDPPFPIFGLPRVVGTAAQLQALFAAVPSAANGLCFCTGSLGVLAQNQLPHMIRTFGHRIHFLHLRNVLRNDEGDFMEADHLYGSTDMAAVMTEIVQLMRRENRRIVVRPDHGHQLLDDLRKKTNPGYSAIGRLKGLAELRGLELGLSHQMG